MCVDELKVSYQGILMPIVLLVFDLSKPSIIMYMQYTLYDEIISNFKEINNHIMMITNISQGIRRKYFEPLNYSPDGYLVLLCRGTKVLQPRGSLRPIWSWGTYLNMFHIKTLLILTLRNMFHNNPTIEKYPTKFHEIYSKEINLLHCI